MSQLHPAPGAVSAFSDQVEVLRQALPHGAEFAIVIVFALALVIGAATRKVAKKLGFPYTIAMLGIGILCGIVVDPQFHELVEGVGGHGHHFGAKDLLVWALYDARSIRPDLIIFVFLPALIFESAYAIDLHTFKKTVGPAVVYAVPAMLISTLVTGLVAHRLLSVTGVDFDAHYIGEYAVVNGSLLVCLVFGALISATDPVAVVALLSELGVSKKMSHLIEGESLLNDGTAIVLFSVLIGLAVGEPFEGWSPTLWGFLKVVTGGVLVGLLLAGIGSWWLGRTFNDPLVEISLTVALGYAAMFIAEGMFHVSGVMALVAAGLWLGGPGKTKVSPEVSHFLHHFWHLLAYIANTLIFFLVGNLMGSMVITATASDVVLILAIYLSIVVIRYLVILAFRPMANWTTSDPINVSDVAVISWGGLRGAVSMALVLILASNDKLPPFVRSQLLMLTSGVVFLTIAINGTTMGWLLRRLGYSDTPDGEQLALATAQASVMHHVQGEIDRVKTSRELRTVSWRVVEDELRDRTGGIQARIDELRSRLESSSPSERAVGYWVQALNVERQAYWQSFSAGTLVDRAVKVLDHELNLHLDHLAAGDVEPPNGRTSGSSSLSGGLHPMLRLTGAYAKVQFSDLQLRYDLARAESAAASKVIRSLSEMAEVAPDVALKIEETYRAWQRAAKERLEAMRIELPEVTRAIETRLAQRIALNFERAGYERLGHQGVLEEDAAHHFAGAVEEKMRRLALGETSVAPPTTAELLLETPLFHELPLDVVTALADMCDTIRIEAGETLFEQGDVGDSMYVIIHGVADVLIDSGGEDRVVDVFGGGDIFGEMSLVSGAPRSASIVATTGLTLVQVGREAFERMMERAAVHDTVWEAFAQRSFDNYLRRRDDFWHLDRQERLRWISGREQVQIGAGQRLSIDREAALAFVMVGEATVGGELAAAPALVELREDRSVTAKTDARLVLLPAIGAAAAPS